jgi:o-succinylbenzoate synthase
MEPVSGLAALHICKISLHRYAVPFIVPIRIGGKELSAREGLIISLTDDKGFTGYGEIAPLEGFSKETLSQAERQLDIWGKELLNTCGTVGDRHACPVNNTGIRLYSSVQFGLETAVLNLSNAKSRKVFPGLTAFDTKREIPVNALLNADVKGGELEGKVKGLVDEGFKSIKIKTGRESLEKDIERIIRVGKNLPDGGSMRLDANRLWDFNTAVSFAKGIECVKEFVEYIEEPFIFDTPDRISRFFESMGIPVALDESLERVLGEDNIPEGVGAFVLKPTMLGGVGRLGVIIDLAKARGIDIVFSSCYECGPGFVEICRLVLKFGADGIASGLDTLKYMKPGLFFHTNPIENGFISVSSLSNALNNNLSNNLEEMEQVFVLE